MTFFRSNDIAIMDMYFSQIIGNSPIVSGLIRKASIVSATNVTILLYGETGTGKELFAQALQQASRRKNQPFMTCNCALFKETLFESELFGHKKGSFTGAISDKTGIVELMDGGTLFLDEINSTSLEVQGKLLRFLENREYLPLGDRKTRFSDVRIIAASNADCNGQQKPDTCLGSVSQKFPLEFDRGLVAQC